MVELILAKGTNVNVSGYWKGNTLLHAAARSGKKETIKLLLAKGANPKAKNTDGKTPWETVGNTDDLGKNRPPSPSPFQHNGRSPIF